MPLLWAVRRAVDRVPRAELPAILRPFAGWKPERLSGLRPRRAIAQALAEDPVLREQVGKALHDQQAYADAAQLDAGRLASAHGDAVSVAALAAHAEWDGLATLAAAAVERLAAESRSAAEARRHDGMARAGTGDGTEEETTRRELESELASTQAEYEMQRRRADAAEEQLQQRTEENAELRATVEKLRGEIADRDEQIKRNRQRADQRVARLHRRVEAAEARARVDEQGVAEVADALDVLVRRLRGTLDPQARSEEASGAVTSGSEESAPETRSRSQTSEVPRDIAAAEPGRPCTLPSGVLDGTAAAVRALLKVPELQVVIDGYNVTMAARGSSGLEEQRRWLVQLAAGVAARFGRILTVVFDGTEPGVGGLGSTRGVRVTFTAGEETADERIVELVRGTPADTPVLVVSSDREVASACADLGANVSPSRCFLEAVGG